MNDIEVISYFARVNDEKWWIGMVTEVQKSKNDVFRYCYSGYQVFLINSFYLALLVMITFI